MAITWYSSAGQPADSVGVDGDLNWDTLNRITWGPKGKATSGTWVGTAYSNIGPTGPAMLSGSGAPTSGLGQIGNGYTDTASGFTYLKGNSGWTQQGSIIGPTGLTGATLMSSLATGVGPQGALVSTTLSSTPTVIPFPGSTQAAIFVPPASSALMGVYAYSSAASTLSLYNVTAGATVYSVSIAAGGNIGNQNFSATQYPLTAGSVYQWQVTGSASCSIQILPFYLLPSNTNAPAVGFAGTAGYSASQTFTSTAVRLPVYGSAAGANVWTYTPPRAGGIYTAQATYTPSGSTTSSSSVQLALNYQPIGGGSSAASSLTISPVTATGLPQTIITPRLTDQASTFSTGYLFFWTATGSGTGTLAVNLLPII